MPGKHRSRPGSRCGLLLPLLAGALTVLLCGCYPVPVEEVVSDPVVLRPGGTAVVTIRSNSVYSDHEIRQLPPGLSYEIDSSVGSENTWAVSRIIFHASTSAVPGRYQGAIKIGEDAAGTPLPIVVLPPDAPVSPVPPVTATAGAGHTAVVLADGTVWAWGNNADGELGIGDRMVRGSPVNVDLLSNSETVTAVNSFAGVATAAIGTDGVLGAWGSNRCGQLGRGDQDRSVPVSVPDVPFMQAVRFGFVGALGLTDDGAVWVWGSCAGNGGTPAPARVDGLDGVVRIAAGSRHALALTADGTVWAWGQNDHGQLGSGTTTALEQPTQIADLADVEDIAASGVFSLALTAQGTVWAWGNIVAGVVENGRTPIRTTPVQVAGLGDIDAIAAGPHFALALTSAGTVLQWAGQYSGRIDPAETRPDRMLLAEVAGLSSITHIAVGYSHAVAVTECGQLWGWGGNSYRQLVETDAHGFADPILLPAFADAGNCDRVALRVNLVGKGAVRATALELDCDTYTCVGAYNRGTTVSLTAQPYVPPRPEDDEDEDPLAAPTVFSGWEGDCRSADAEITIALNATTRCSAVFESTTPELFLVTVSVSGFGTVASSSGGVLGPDSILCGSTCEAMFAEDTEITLTAQPSAPGFELIGWDGDCSGTDPRITFAMNGNVACQARFGPSPEPEPEPEPEPQPVQFLLSTGISGLGTGTVTGIGILCPGDCTEAFDAGTEVMLTATADAGSVFSGWSVVNHPDCADGPTTIAVVMDDDKLCRAVFVEAGPEAGVTIHVSISNFGDSPNNRITSFPEGIDCRSGPDPFENDGICEAHFTDEQVRIFAEPADGDGFNFWSSNCFEEEPLTCLLDNPNDGSTVNVGAAFDPS